MREIKFRAWDTVKKVMYSAQELGADQETLSVDGRGLVNVSGTSTRLSQFHSHLLPLEYTGLKDKNGTEIYEGDILDRLDNIICVVTFEDGKFGWDISYKHPEPNQRKDCFGRSYANQEEASKLEVIGNIYENKELLEK